MFGYETWRYTRGRLQRPHLLRPLFQSLQVLYSLLANGGRLLPGTAPASSATIRTFRGDYSDGLMNPAQPHESCVECVGPPLMQHVGDGRPFHIFEVRLVPHEGCVECCSPS